MSRAPSIRIASWNVNGIRARLANVLEWLRETAPDIAMLQETKAPDEVFPREPFEDANYNLALHGQKRSNGVAILSKYQLEDVERGLPDAGDDAQARWITARVFPESRPLRVCCLYAPNGNPAPGEKYGYKLAWMKRLLKAAGELRETGEAVIMGGDYNVIPQPLDAYDPEAWLTDALYLPESRAAWRRLAHSGWLDALRTLAPNDPQYSFWDYRNNAFARDHGIRIDHLLLSPQAADRLCGGGTDSMMRGREHPSDHVPVWCEVGP